MISYQELAAKERPLAVIGLGYVGLPLAVALSEHFEVIGFDISAERIAELSAGRDRTREVTAEELARARVRYTADPAELKKAGLIIVAVPTPIDHHRNPDLTPVVGSSRTVGQNISAGTIVCYESTVYPGLTEDVCGPIIEKHSGLACGRDFFLGYSPERINPGDRQHTLSTIVKVVAGQTEAVGDLLAKVYGLVVTAGIHLAGSIRVAEAAKVIENTQRDLNIALMNELAVIFDRMGIDTQEVLAAAGTKWNFLPFRPGLVGGHCIGVDPYYLTWKAEELGYMPQVILAGRRINDSMGKFIAEKCIKLLVKNDCHMARSRVGVLGLTFKENVPDLRNTRVIDIVRELAEYCPEVLIHDPLADPEEARREYDLTLSPLEALRDLDALVLAVPHAAYAALTPAELTGWFRPGAAPVVLDVKGILDPAAMTRAGCIFWRL